MHWMILQDNDTGRLWLWDSQSSYGLVEIGSDLFSPTTLTLPALNSQLEAAWYQNTRTATAGGKSFEVLASGRI